MGKERKGFVDVAKCYKNGRSVVFVMPKSIVEKLSIESGERFLIRTTQQGRILMEKMSGIFIPE